MFYTRRLTHCLGPLSKALAQTSHHCSLSGRPAWAVHSIEAAKLGRAQQVPALATHPEFSGIHSHPKRPHMANKHNKKPSSVRKSDSGNRRSPSSTTSLGKRRSHRQPRASNQMDPSQGSNSASDPGQNEYGSQSSPMRVPTPSAGLLKPAKVAILGAAGGIGQPLALLLKVHSEYVQHLALYDVAHVQGVVADMGHVDRQCRVTAHEGPDELANAVRDAKVIVVLAGLAQKPGMSRDDLFGTNAKIMYNLAKVCVQVAPEAHLAVVSNPVNSLVPLTCELYSKLHNTGPSQQASTSSSPTSSRQAPAEQSLSAAQATANKAEPQQRPQQPPERSERQSSKFHECCRRIFGVTTLDVVRASTLTAESAFFIPEPNGLSADPSNIQVPVVGGHAGKTIIPLLSQAVPRIERKKLEAEKATRSALINSIQQAGIDVLNAKKGKGSATLAMAYSACRFTISLLRAQLGEKNIVECAYVRHRTPIVADLDYFAAPLVLGKQGYVKALDFGLPPKQPQHVVSDKGLMPFELQMIDEAVAELKSSIAKGEDFAREHLISERP